MLLIPNVIEKKNNSERVYDLYSKLLEDRIIMIYGEIDDNVSNIVVAELLYLDSINNDDISLYINSNGGSITAGMAIYDTMNFIKSDVSTICIGMCASMAAFLLSSGKKGKRYSLKNSEIMIHQPLGGAKGQATDIEIHAKWILKIKERLNKIKIAADRILKIRKNMNKILSLNTNKDIKTIKKDTERDNFMSSYEALSYGIIDKIL